MPVVEYRELAGVKPALFLPLLNSARVRQHLMTHAAFTEESAAAWLQEKRDLNTRKGCWLRAVWQAGTLAGWCGIQPDADHFELAIVLADDHWGIGPQIFRELMRQAKALGHPVVYIHLLHTRPEYNFLRKRASRVLASELNGHRFITYELPTG
ncbi:GNAT family N-acetyltransferase [Pseudomaricurvus sp. HS19]|uniref:GNAT family N-acetyltransferase n=1 Tax=Pseudomaricurvus sp. HS19 TaxID=2692626 RepID=UPI0013721C79|nr:GNAT family N-acetyltransferase [Pseudomaricurvus sp. HS19]MYM64215.1 N-acetyltransferase [Pseudomaricurvus sp. HS19]